MARATGRRSSGQPAVGPNSDTTDAADKTVSLMIVSLHDHPWTLDIALSETAASLKRKVIEHYETKHKYQVPAANVELRMKTSHASPGHKLDGRKLLRECGVKAAKGNTASVFFLVRPPPGQAAQHQQQEPQQQQEEGQQQQQQEQVEAVEEERAIVPEGTSAGEASGSGARAPPTPLVPSRREGGVRETLEAVQDFNREQEAARGAEEEDDFLEEPRHTTRAPPRSPGDRKKAQRWANPQINDLVKGVERHGVGQWRAILADPGLSFPDSANQVTLKDRWRNLVKTIEEDRTPRGWSLTHALALRVNAILEPE